MLYNQKEEISDDLKELINLGLFIVFDKKVELYHGRARLQSEQGEWEVDPNFDNSGNATGNMNIFGIKTISTGTKEIAEKFANNRVKSHSNSTAEIHRIYPITPNSLIFNRFFDMEKLTEQDRNKLYKILRKVNIEDTLEAVPVPFEYRNIAKAVFISLKYELKSDKESYLTDKNVEKVSILLNVEKDIVSSIAGVINAKKLLTYYPKKAIVRFGLEEDELERFSFGDQNGESCPFNPEFVAYWLIKNNVIGLKSRVYSGTLNEKIEVCYLFDITKVNTLKAINNKIYAINQEYGPITKLLETCFKNKQLLEFFTKASPKELAQYAKNNSEVGNIRFKESAGVWEGFTIGEHTETVLRVFEDSYNLKVPKELVPFLKIVILTHDIEKGLNDSNNPNHQVARQFLRDFGVDGKHQDIILDIIYKSQLYTTSYFVNKDNSALSKYRFLTKEMIRNFAGRNSTEQEENGLIGISKILQTCDSGAYTRFAVTRKNGVYYYNGNDRFGKSFENPLGMNNRQLILKEPTK